MPSSTAERVAAPEGERSVTTRGQSRVWAITAAVALSASPGRAGSGGRGAHAGGDPSPTALWLSPGGGSHPNQFSPGVATVETASFCAHPPRARRRHRLGTTPDLRLHCADRPNQVWTYDVLHEQLADGRWFKTVSILDEFTRECVTIKVGRTLRTPEVIAALTEAMSRQGPPTFLRSDNGSEFTATAVMAWLQAQAIGPVFIPPGRPYTPPAQCARLQDPCAIPGRVATLDP